MPRKKTNKLTNYKLWKSLDEITKEKQTTETTIKFAELLKKGYIDDTKQLTSLLTPYFQYFPSLKVSFFKTRFSWLTLAVFSILGCISTKS